MRIRSKHLAALAVAGAASLGALAPAASAETVCHSIGKDGKDPLRSTACVVVTQDTEGTTVTVACSLLADRAACAIKPVSVPAP